MAIQAQRVKAKKAALAYFGASVSGVGFSTGAGSGRGATTLPIGNVIGVGLGARSTESMGVAGEDVVRVYVGSKDALTATVPTHFGDLPTDVVEVGDVMVTALLTTGQRFGRHRPSSCGVSVGHPSVTVGTLGCRVKKGGSCYILSNNHVLADSNLASLGDAILQPGSYDGGKSPADEIAGLTDFQTIRFGGAANDFDAAIAELNDPTDLESDIIDIGPSGKVPRAAMLYESVRKHGRTTGHTVGVVVDTSVSLWIGYGKQRAWFQDQIAIQGVGAAHFSAGGDSGSLIVDAVDLEPVALLFAGSSSGLTFGNPILPVLNHFKVTID